MGSMGCCGGRRCKSTYAPLHKPNIKRAFIWLQQTVICVVICTRVVVLVGCFPGYSYLADTLGMLNSMYTVNAYVCGHMGQLGVT